MPSDDETYMRLALERCREGVLAGQSPFGAVIVRDGQILAATHNRVRLDTDPSAHGEVVCIRAACRHVGDISLKGATIYSTTEPCPMCFTAIHWADIGRIVYAARVEDAKRFGFKELQISNAKMKQVSGSEIELVPDMLRDDALALYDLWKEQRGVPY
ncbi:MAG: nucleoside deaminase [Phycisphaerae bacterium]